MCNVFQAMSEARNLAVALGSAYPSALRHSHSTEGESLAIWFPVVVQDPVLFYFYFFLQERLAECCVFILSARDHGKYVGVG